ncbi:MAG: DUF4860 domain-containing protein [Oscillospiraceae bacterium]|nr:DUF4860 domain-containing protein [Oscillospiraceae bacterium]
MKRYIHTADAVFALILFCAFALSMLMVLMTGAVAYQDVRDAVENHYSEDTCISYIAMKVRHYDDASGSFELRDLDGVPALYMTESVGGGEYFTAIYFYDGYVKELYAESGYEFAPGDGADVLAAEALSFEVSDRLLHVSCVGTGGNAADIYLSLPADIWQAPADKLVDIWQAPVQDEPADIWQAPVQDEPADIWQAPVQGEPAGIWQAPVQGEPADIWQAPALGKPTDIWQAPALGKPADIWQDPTQGNRKGGF